MSLLSSRTKVPVQMVLHVVKSSHRLVRAEKAVLHSVAEFDFFFLAQLATRNLRLHLLCIGPNCYHSETTICL